jgi:hypothetical protein
LTAEMLLNKRWLIEKLHCVKPSLRMHQYLAAYGPAAAARLRPDGSFCAWLTLAKGLRTSRVKSHRMVVDFLRDAAGSACPVPKRRGVDDRARRSRLGPARHGPGPPRGPRQ